MDRWQQFLDSLATPGAAILILVVSAIVLATVTLFVGWNAAKFGAGLVEAFSTLLGGVLAVLFRDLTRR